MVTEWFDSEFWPFYPKREDKANALKADVMKYGKTEADRSAIIERLKADLPDLTGREIRFIPLPAAWLNKQRWKDGPPGPNEALAMRIGPAVQPIRLPCLRYVAND